MDPIDGLGITEKYARQIVQDDKQALDELDEVLQNPGSIHTAVDNMHSNQRPSGTSESAALRRLRKQRPDLYAEVLAGELTDAACCGSDEKDHHVKP